MLDELFVLKHGAALQFKAEFVHIDTIENIF